MHWVKHTGFRGVIELNTNVITAKFNYIELSEFSTLRAEDS